MEGGKKVATVPLLENCKNIPVGQKQRTKVLLGYLTAVTGTVTNRQVNGQNTRNYHSSLGGGGHFRRFREEMFVKICCSNEKLVFPRYCSIFLPMNLFPLEQFIFEIMQFMYIFISGWVMIVQDYFGHCCS